MYFIGLSFAKIFPSLLKKVQVMLKQAPISEASLEWGLSILLKSLVASRLGSRRKPGIHERSNSNL
jgi:hypothetical protein